MSNKVIAGQVIGNFKKLVMIKAVESTIAKLITNQ